MYSISFINYLERQNAICQADGSGTQMRLPRSTSFRSQWQERIPTSHLHLYIIKRPGTLY